MDPYLLAVVSSVFCLTDVFLLYFTGNITTYVFLSYVFTQCTFFIGFHLMRARKAVFSSPPDNRMSYNKPRAKEIIAFYFFSIVYLVSQCAIYMLKGIPLFMESRLETFASGGGTGILGRICDVSSIFSLYAFFAVIKIDKFRLSEMPKYFILCLIFVTFLLSGSKSSFLVIFYVFWCYIMFAKLKKLNYLTYIKLLKKNVKLIVITSLGVVSVIIFVQTKTQIENPEDRLNPLLGLCLRLVHSGDVYWYAYPNNVYLKIPAEHWFTALFNDTLGLLRIKNWDELPEAIGITFKNIHHPSDVPQGPNARHNIFGLIYYGFFGGIIFSFCLGLLLGFIRNIMPQLLSASMLGGFVFTYLINKSTSLDSDPMLTITYFNNIIFVFPVLYFVYLIVVELFMINPINNEVPA